MVREVVKTASAAIALLRLAWMQLDWCFSTISRAIETASYDRPSVEIQDQVELVRIASLEMLTR